MHMGDDPDYAGYDYPPTKFEVSQITNEQIHREISKLEPHKAPGPGRISNTLLIQGADLVMPHLGLLYWVTFDLGVYPSQWRDSATIVLRKPAKPDHTVPGAHCPIVLLNMVAKVLSACVAEDLIQMGVVHGILQDNHFRCHPGRTTTDSLHFAMKLVKDAWRKREEVSTLFLEVKSTFLSVLLN